MKAGVSNVGSTCYYGDSSLTCHSSTYCKTCSCCCWLPPCLRRTERTGPGGETAECEREASSLRPHWTQAKHELEEPSEWAAERLCGGRRSPMGYTTTERGARAVCSAHGARADADLFHSRGPTQRWLFFFLLAISSLTVSKVWVDATSQWIKLWFVYFDYWHLVIVW